MSEPQEHSTLSERTRRQVDRLLDEAEQAIGPLDWATVRDRARAALALDPQNPDGRNYLAAAERELGGPPEDLRAAAEAGLAVVTETSLATSFVGGRYQVVRLLGEGATKRVYLAHDTKLDRDVAFALIKTEGLDADGLTRIRREAQAMARLGDHPNIVAVYDIGDTSTSSAQAGQPYIVSQYMAGGDLQHLIEQAPDHRIPLEQVTKIAEQVCEALQHAHSQGVIHRDLKPGNVWLSGGLGSGVRGLGDEKKTPASLASSPLTPKPQTLTPIVAKLGDFGLAIALDRSRLTQAGMMVGTVAYMAPEQALGGEVTPRSDLYSLGCVLYELVTGRPPFVGDDSVAIISQHLNTPPVAPSWHNPDLPGGLEPLILRLLEKDPARRPASANEAREALANIHPQPLPTTAYPFPEGEGTDGRGTVSPSGRGRATAGSQGEGEPGYQDPTYRRTFVGREQELAQLQRAFDAALSGQGSLAMVVGEPGIGKTSLCEQLATYVAVRGGRALVGHCYEEGSLSLPYLPFVEAMRSYVLSQEPDRLKEQLGTGAGEVARIVSEIRDRVQVELPPAGDPEDDRWRLLQAVTGFLRNAATVHPLLIVLEDLHDADKGTLDLLLHLSRNLQGARVVIVGTYRDVEVDRSHPLSGTLAELRRAANFLRVPLRGLTIDEVQRMISNIRGQEVSWSRAESYHRQTEGNPLFVQEVLRYLVEEGLVVRESGRYALADPTAPEAGIPEGLRDVIGKRLSRLSADCNRLLAIAAVIGRDFDLQTLRTLAGVAEDALLTSIEEAVRVGVLEERAQTGRVTYRFAHAFFRQTLYEEMIAPRRLRLHQEVARALEDQYGARREEHAAELAEHFAQSTDRADLAKAVEYGELAAQRAMSVFAYAEAARHLERCLAVQEVLDPDDKAKRCDLLLTLGAALSPAGEPLRVAEEIAEEAFALSEALGDSQRAFACCRVALDAASRYGAATMMGTDLGARWLERAERYAEPGTPERARVLGDLSIRQMNAGRWAEVWTMKDEALRLARQTDDPETLFYAAFQMVNGGSAPRSWETRLRVAEEFSGRPRLGVSTRTLVGFLHQSSTTLLAGGQRDAAEAAWRELEELSVRTQDPHVLLRSLACVIYRFTLDGQLEEALTAGEHLVTRSDELGSPIYGQQFGNQRIRALLYLGRPEEALQLVGSAARMAGIGERLFDIPTRALCLAHLGRLEEARDQLLGLPDLMNHEAWDGIPIDFSTLALEVALLAEDPATASWLAERLSAFAPFLIEAHFTCIARQLGAAAALLGERAKAEAYYRQAIEVCERTRFRPELALSRFQLAELLLAGSADGKAEALDHLDFVSKEFEAMKMARSQERAVALQGKLQA